MFAWTVLRPQTEVIPRLRASTAIVTMLLPLVHPRMGTPFASAPRASQLEPPGFLMLNYGLRTPVVMLAAHAAYGAIIGAILQIAG